MVKESDRPRKQLLTFQKNMKQRTFLKSVQRDIGFVIFFSQYLPKLAKKLIQLHKSLQKDVKFVMIDLVKDSIFEINENLAKPAKMTLRLPIPEKQLVIMCDTCEHAAGKIRLTEPYTDTARSTHKFYAPVAFVSCQFATGQMSVTIYGKQFLAIHFAVDEFGNLLWRVKKHSKVITDDLA